MARRKQGDDIKGRPGRMPRPHEVMRKGGPHRDQKRASRRDGEPLVDLMEDIEREKI